VMIMVSHVVPLMFWGHFAARKKLDEVQSGHYFSAKWIQQSLVSRSFLEFIREHLSDRLHKLVTQRKNMSSEERNQIPSSFLKHHEDEIKYLALWVPQAESIWPTTLAPRSREEQV
jgi:hypothetical protein